MSAHTPAPWRLDTVDDHMIVTQDGRLELCSCFDEDGTGAPDAAHIVRCVNSHDALVAALRSLVGDEMINPNAARKGDLHMPSWNTVQAARAVLTAAEAS